MGGGATAGAAAPGEDVATPPPTGSADRAHATLAVEARAIRYDHRRRGRPSSRHRDGAEGGTADTTGRVGPIDFVAERGTVVGLVGPNGSGKTTLLRLLATLLEPAAGELRLFGEPVGRRGGAGAIVGSGNAQRRRIGWVPDAAPHFRRLTGRENVVLFARAAGMSAADAERAAGPLLERLGLAADAGRAAREYSFGMARKLAIAEALVHAPPLVLLDEPTIGLDPDARVHALALLRERAADGAAVILATNDVAAAGAACDRVALLHRGRIVAAGQPAELVAAAGTAQRIEVTWDAGPLEGADGVRPPAGSQRLDARPGASPPQATSRTPQAHGESRPHAILPTLPAGVDLLAAEHGWLRVRAEAGAAVLPELLRALLDHGCAIRSVAVRRPDLRDAFETLAGAGWDAAEEVGP